jgi:uncharacterized membrane protein
MTGLGVASLTSLGLLTASSIVEGELMYPFLVWNLFLAWLPLILAVWLVTVLKRKLWSSWEAIIISIAWLALLPNSFYMVSDFIHLNELSSSQILLGAVTFTAFAFASLCLGVTSLYLVHREFLKRVSSRSAALLVGALLLIASIAIYIGRDLRWNSWDVVVNPAGLLFDLSDRLLHPSQYGSVLSVVLPFFVLLATVYFVAVCFVRAMQAERPD